MPRRKKIPQRQCVGCREMKPKKELVRVVRTPAAEILVDPTGKKSGRGAYICFAERCLNEAVKKKRLERALEQVVPEEVIETIREELVRRCPKA
uniref:YlxR family protein n=1 Tax=Ammonifex degensii TaxID=42838 RepID=A0A7C2I399_9THEO